MKKKYDAPALGMVTATDVITTSDPFVNEIKWDFDYIV